jgi:hypothetical protein
MGGLSWGGGRNQSSSVETPINRFESGWEFCFIGFDSIAGREKAHWVFFGPWPMGVKRE